MVFVKLKHVWSGINDVVINTVYVLCDKYIPWNSVTLLSHQLCIIFFCGSPVMGNECDCIELCLIVGCEAFTILHEAIDG
jgi:hypothetical protein